MDKKTAFNQDIVLKLRQPSMEEVKLFKEGGILYSFLYPGQNKDLIDALAKKKLTAFGMDCVPRISRAQVFDALSSMGNISGKMSTVFFLIPHHLTLVKFLNVFLRLSGCGGSLQSFWPIFHWSNHCCR